MTTLEASLIHVGDPLAAPNRHNGITTDGGHRSHRGRTLWAAPSPVLPQDRRHVSMPPIPQVPGTVALTVIQADAFGARWQNRVHFRTTTFTGIWPPADLHVLNQWFQTKWKSNFAQYLSAGCNFAQFEAQDLGPTGLLDIITDGAAGGDAGARYPMSVAACVSWLAAARYRGGHFRTYMGGLTQSMGANSRQMQGSQAVALRNSGKQFISDMAAVVLPAVTGSPQLCGIQRRGPAALGPYPVAREIFDAHVHERWDSQRRRLGKESAFPEV